MLSSFVDFVDSVMPSVDPDFRDGAKKAIQQFEKEGNQPNFLMRGILSEMSQGDIISSLPFLYFDDSGSQHTFISDAMVLSTSCHIDQKDKLVFAPVVPLSKFKGNDNALKELKANMIYDVMYIPDPKLCGSFVSFSVLNTYSKELIFEGIKKGKFKRYASLNQLGYYLFVIKLSVYFMRREDRETLKTRQNCQYGSI